MTTVTDHTDPTNAAILSISEDLLRGFHRQPFHVISERSGIPLETVIDRIKGMVASGVIRRVRQTLVATKLAHGALVAWRVSEDKLTSAFDYMAAHDPFSGHVVVRSTDGAVVGAEYRLWTTLKVPVGESLEEHADSLKRIVGADSYVLMPAKGVFALGVGHIRRRSLSPGEKSEQMAKMMTTDPVDLTKLEWDVALALKEELSLSEICQNPWTERAAKIGMSIEAFCVIARDLDRKGVLGRFSTFLEHTKPSQTGERVTRFNGLFHWAIPKGREIEVGGEIGRHHCMTHCYWREGGSRFGNVNIMGVVHGTEKSRVLEHKDAIDRHLRSLGIPVSYTNVFWGGRSEIKPSEISLDRYRDWHTQAKLQPLLR
jgi:DNA-binding Lrp family transcriptional regulator